MNGIVRFFTNNKVWAIIILALLIRVIYLISFAQLPNWDHLTVDANYHHNRAAEIAGGNILGDDVYIRGPLYVYILGFLYFIFGKVFLVGRLLGLAIGLVSVWLTYKVVGAVLSKKIAVIAAFLHAVVPLFIYFESELLVDSLFLMLFELAIFLTLIAVKKNKLAWFIAAGVAAGLAVITRPVILALIPAFIIWILIAPGKLKRKILSCAILIVSAVLIILPVTLINVIAHDDFVTVASSGGINFYIGNNPHSDGLSAAMPPPLGNTWEYQDIKSLAETDSGRRMRWSEISDYYYHKGLTWIADNPGDFIKLYVKKIYHLFNNYNFPNNRYMSVFFDEVLILGYNPFDFGLIMILSVFGFVLSLIRRECNRPMLLILILIIAYTLVISFFFVNARFRLPLLPLLIVFSSYGLYNVFTTDDKLNLVLPVVAGAAAGFLTFSNLYGFKENDAAAYYQQATYHYQSGDLETAAECYRRVLAEDRQFPNANLNMGILMMRRNYMDSAAYYINREIEYNPDNANACSGLATLLMRGKYFPDAVRAAKTAVDLKPQDPNLYPTYIRAIAAAHDTLSLAGVTGAIRESLNDNPALYLEAANTYSQWGLTDSAFKYYRIILHEAKRPLETTERTETDIDLNHDSVEKIKSAAANELVYLFAAVENYDSAVYYGNVALQYDSANVRAYINYINALVMSGRRQEAKKVINKAINRFPESNTFPKMLRSL